MITATLHTTYGDVTIRHTTGWQDRPGPVYIDTRMCYTEADAREAGEAVRRWLRVAMGMWGHGAGSAESMYQFNLWYALNNERCRYMQAWAPEIAVVGQEELGPEWDLPPDAVG